MTEPIARFTRADGRTATVVTVEGELDATNTAELRDRLGASMEDAVGRRLVVDLSAVSFLDSSTVNVIVWARKRSRELNTSLRVVAPPGSRAALVFELAGIGSIVPLADAVSDAERPAAG